MTRDHDFIVDRHPRYKTMFVVAGMSGERAFSVNSKHDLQISLERVNRTRPVVFRRSRVQDGACDREGGGGADRGHSALSRRLPLLSLPLQPEGASESAVNT